MKLPSKGVSVIEKIGKLSSMLEERLRTQMNLSPGTHNTLGLLSPE